MSITDCVSSLSIPHLKSCRQSISSSSTSDGKFYFAVPVLADCTLKCDVNKHVASAATSPLVRFLPPKFHFVPKILHAEQNDGSSRLGDKYPKWKPWHRIVRKAMQQVAHRFRNRSCGVSSSLSLSVPHAIGVLLLVLNGVGGRVAIESLTTASFISECCSNFYFPSQYWVAALCVSVCVG